MRIYERFDKTNENREPQRAYYIPYDSLEKALRGDPTGHYSKMTKQTQNIYKAAIKREAKKQKKSQICLDENDKSVYTN